MRPVLLAAVMLAGVLAGVVPTASAAPQPFLWPAIQDDEVELGSWARIKVIAENDGTEADWQTIQLSFPSGLPRSNIRVLDAYGLDSWAVHGPGSTLYSDYGSRQRSTSYLLVEGIDEQWPAGRDRYLEVEVKPEEVGAFTFQYKTVAARDGVIFYDPSSGPKDQQGEYVRTGTIQVTGTRSFEIEVSDVQPSQVAPGETVTLTFNGRNTGSETRSVREVIQVREPDGDLHEGKETTHNVAPGSQSVMSVHFPAEKEGTHQVDFRLLDADTGHEYAHETGSFLVDREDRPPTCQSQQGPPTRVAAGQTFTLRVQCQDSDGDLAGGWWLVDGVQHQEESSSGGSDTEEHEFSLTPGSHQLGYYAVDARGAASDSVSWTVDVQKNSAASPPAFQQIWRDGFDETSTGAFPSSWRLVYDGTGSSDQHVSNEDGRGNVLHLHGKPNWSSVADRSLDAGDHRLVYVAYDMLIEQRMSGGADHPGPWSKDHATWGTYWGTLRFDHGEGLIRSDTGVDLGPWEPGTWMAVEVVVDRDAEVYDVWIDGALRGQDLPTPADAWAMEALALTSGHPGSPVYFDDVVVGYVPGDGEADGGADDPGDGSDDGGGDDDPDDSACLPEHPQPAVFLQADVVSGTAPLEVAFSTAVEYGCPLATWSMEYGDGSSDSGTWPPPTLRHTFSEGTHDARFEVHAEDGSQGQATLTLRVRVNPPTPPTPPESGPVRGGTGVFLVHGVCSDGGKWTSDSGRPLVDALRARGFIVSNDADFYTIDPQRFRTPHLQVEATVDALQAFLRDGDGERTPERVVVIGHSNGGLLARGLLRHSDVAGYIDRVVTLDSPDLGVEWAPTPEDAESLSGSWLLCQVDQKAHREAWWNYAREYLLREDGIARMHRAVEDAPPVLSDDDLQDDRIKRVIFTDCKISNCIHGNRIVDEEAADWGGAHVFAIMAVDVFLENRMGSAAINVCSKAPTGAPDQALVVYEKKDLKVLHSEGVRIFAHAIAGLAVDGSLDANEVGHERHRIQDCSELGEVERRHAEQMAARADFRTQDVQQMAQPLAEGTEVVAQHDGRSYRVQVHVEDGEGRFVVVNLPPDEPWDGLRVLLDGEEVPWAPSFDSLTGPQDLDEASYVITQGEALVQVAVWVPHFSTRVIEIVPPVEHLAQDNEDRPVPGPAFVVVILVVVALAFRRRSIM